MFPTNAAEKSTEELGAIWQRRRNSNHRRWVLPLDVSLQGTEGEILCPQATSPSPIVQKGVLQTTSYAATRKVLTRQDLRAELVLTIR